VWAAIHGRKGGNASAAPTQSFARVDQFDDLPGVRLFKRGVHAERMPQVRASFQLGGTHFWSWFSEAAAMMLLLARCDCHS